IRSTPNAERTRCRTPSALRVSPLASSEKLLHSRVWTFGEEPPGVQGDLRLGLGIEEDAVVADGEDARQLMGDHDDRGAEAVAQLENKIIQQPRADRIETGRRF